MRSLEASQFSGRRLSNTGPADWWLWLRTTAWFSNGAAHWFVSTTYNTRTAYMNTNHISCYSGSRIAWTTMTRWDELGSLHTGMSFPKYKHTDWNWEHTRDVDTQHYQATNICCAITCIHILLLWYMWFLIYNTTVSMYWNYLSVHEHLPGIYMFYWFSFGKLNTVVSKYWFDQHFCNITTSVGHLNLF